MGSMLTKDILERFLDGPFNYKELRIRVDAYVGEKLAGLETSSGVQPMDIWQLDKSDGDDEDVNAVQRRQHHRFNQKAEARVRQLAHTGVTPVDATRQGTGERRGKAECVQEEASRVRCGGTGHPARLCPSADDCQDVDDIGTEPSRDADSDLFGLDWGDDPFMNINSVTSRSNRTRCGKELLASADSGAVDNVLPMMMCIEYPLEMTTKSQSGVGFKGAKV